MRIVASLLLLGLGLCLGGQPARADARLFVDLPIALDFEGDIEGGAESVSGYAVGWGFPLHVGLDVAEFTGTANDTQKNVKTDVTYSFVDAFIFFKGWGWDWQVGYGEGDVEVAAFQDTTGTQFTVDTADATQWFLSIGWPLAQRWTVHVGYRNISADETQIRSTSGFVGPYDLSASAWTLGLQLVFP